jgi:hypothetical protein
MYKLTTAGGVTFWATTFLISLTPIAADYRDVFSISYIPMLVESLVAGLIIGGCVSYSLLRFFNKIPTKDPIVKSVILSFVALCIATVMIEGGTFFLVEDGLYYFLIVVMINLPRFLFLGIAVGYLYKRLYSFELSKN